jgi:hypothetical protein
MKPTCDIKKVGCFGLVALFLALVSPAYGAYGDHDGPYGQNDGIHADDARIQGWATMVVDSWRPEGINFGVPADVLSNPGGTFDTFSLGDGGWIVVGFSEPIADGPGPDFAVWENGFISVQPGTSGLLFAEFMFVEVSTDGENYVRFPSINLVPATPALGGFGCIDPTYVYNVAGKHPNGNDDRDEGTPFDLADLSDDPLVNDGTVDLTDIRYVRLVDVIGDGSTFDSEGNPMWDPYPTPFGTGGADLDAVGILNERRANVPPDTPALMAPYEGEAGVSLAPELKTGAFSDADSGESHLNTQWQLSTVADPDGFESALVFDVTSSVALTRLQLPGGSLDTDTTYYWRVRFYDSYGIESYWSDMGSFSTMDTADVGGVPSDQALNPGSDVDVNANGTDDIEEQLLGHIKVVNVPSSAAPQGQVGISVGAAATVSFFEYRDPGDNVGRPDEIFLGTVSFKLILQPGETEASPTLYFSERVPRDYSWWKYSLAQGWHEVPNTEFSSDRRSVRFTVVDGGPEDADGIENGVIFDPTGAGKMVNPSRSPSTSTGGGGGSGGVGGCFIGVCLPFQF